MLSILVHSFLLSAILQLYASNFSGASWGIVFAMILYGCIIIFNKPRRDNF